jgi:hypothetical protein
MSAQSSSANPMVRVILWIYLVDNLAFGLVALLLPAFLVETLGAEPPFHYYWLRWAGGVLVAVAIGAWLAQRKPERERTYITFGAAASLLAGVGLLGSELAGEYHGAGWFFGLTMLASFPMAVLLAYGRRLIGQTST